MPSPRRRLLTIVLAVLAVPVLLVAGYTGYLAVSGTPLIDEWHCARDEAPVDMAAGGRFCAEEGAQLEVGETWDPFGNRPLVCHERWGWTEVFEVEAQDTDEVVTDCVKKGRTAPDGWKPVPAGWDDSQGDPSDF